MKEPVAIGRRGFISAVSAAGASAALRAAVPGLAGSNETKPLLRVGLLSDIHLFDYESSSRKFRRALEYLRGISVDVVVVAGDMAHTGRLSELENVARTWYAVFPDDRYPDGRPVDKVFLYGNHDVSTKPASYLKLTQEGFDAIAIRNMKAEAWKKCFREDFAQLAVRDVRGYKFVTAHWDDGPTVKGAAEFVRAHADELRGGKPFFYIQHAPLNGTLHRWEAPPPKGSVAEALSAFPNAVAITGHTHFPVTDELSAWQGAFTAVNAGCVIQSGYRYSNPVVENGDRPNLAGRKRDELMTPIVDTYPDGSQGLVLDVHADRLVFHRRAFAFNSPEGADWEIPFPAGRGDAFSTARRKAAAVAPEFAASAAISVEKGKFKTRGKQERDGVKVSFPLAEGRGEGGRAFAYEIAASDPSGAKPPLVRHILSPDYHRPPDRLLEKGFIVFDPEELPAGDKTVFSIRPCDSFINYGKALSRMA